MPPLVAAVRKFTGEAIPAKYIPIILPELLPRTSTGILAIGSAAELSITTVDLEGYGFNYGNNYGGP